MYPKTAQNMVQCKVEAAVIHFLDYLTVEVFVFFEHFWIIMILNVVHPSLSKVCSLIFTGFFHGN